MKARATNPATKRTTTRKKNPVSCIRNGKRIYGAAAQAVLKSRGKRSTKKRVNSVSRKRVVARKPTSTKRINARPLTRQTNRRRRNSASSTAAAFEQFQGRASSATVDVMIPDSAPKDVYVLGMLTEIKTDRDEISFDPGDAYLVADKNDNIYVGATKATNSAFEANEFVGEIKELSYVTVKDHLDGEEIEYVHKLGEEGGDKPALITNEKCQLEIIGGDYYITADGIRD